MWASTGRSQLVTEAEIFPHLVARLVWGDHLAGRRVFSFADSEPSKFALVKGGSDSVFCGAIIKKIVEWDAEFVPWNWYSRIPSFSNPADKPSRLDWKSFLGEFPGASIQDVLPILPCAEALKPVS
jgi:hypothetical protein